MAMHTGRAVLGAAAIALSLAVAGCGSGANSPSATSQAETSSTGTSNAETSTAETSTVETSAAEATSSPAAPGTDAAAPDYTVGDYLRDNGITQTMVKRGEPGVPELNLPTPAGWVDVGADTPDNAYGAIVLESAAGEPNPPAIIAQMARLGDGEVDQATILELAPNAVRKLPGFEGPATGRPSSLAGFDAVEIAGTADAEGTPMFVARKTVVIPGRDAIYLLALDAQGPPEHQGAMMEAMATIDAETTIEP
ncbi:LpqN/LpqT family lipoprotein [Mycolicibacterium sp.]|uniref:LpqN/LpqT family lipoprotein n=1 Tax=Mycolicibacterium sp. TaxID=2320850 RepID=UPI003D148151